MISSTRVTPGNSSASLRIAAAWVASTAIVVAMLIASSCSSQETPRQYSEEELAVTVLVEEYVRNAVPFSNYRTLDERTYPSRDDPGGIGHERERNFFEATLRLVMHAANDTLPPDVRFGSGVLHDARDEALSECTTAAGWPDVHVYDASKNDVERYERDYGLTPEMFLDLRHECAKYAATYPTLDLAVRHELLAKRRDHYMTAVRDWIAANPKLLVPVEHHEGANKPYEEYWIRFCLQEDNPPQCAREHRVILPQ